MMTSCCTYKDTKKHNISKLGQKHRRELEDLSLGQAVAMYNPSSKTWGAAEVKENIDEPQSYDVNTAKGSDSYDSIKPIYI